MSESEATLCTDGSGPSASEKKLRRIAALHNVLVYRNLQSRYQDTVLGLAWTLVNPLLFAGVLIFLVQFVLEVNTFRFSSFVYIGVLAYAWFRGALSQATQAVLADRMLARRPGFPPFVLPLVPVTTNLLDFILSIPILVLVLYIGGSQISWALLMIPVIIAVQFLITLGLAYLLASAHMAFRDVGHLVELVLTLGFFLTPIFYEISQVPESMAPIFWINPLVPLLDAYRDTLIYGRWPSFTNLGIAAISGLLLSIVGFQLFRRTCRKYIEDI